MAELTRSGFEEGAASEALQRVPNAFRAACLLRCALPEHREADELRVSTRAWRLDQASAACGGCSWACGVVLRASRGSALGVFVRSTYAVVTLSV